MKSYKTYPVPPVETLKSLYRESAEHFFEKPFLREKLDGEYVEYSFKKFADDVDAVGTELIARGLLGKKILLMGKNSYAWAVFYMAIVSGVGVAIPLKSDSSPESVGAIIERTDAEAIVADSEILEAVRGVGKGLYEVSLKELPELVSSGNQHIIDGDRSFLDAPLSPDEMRVLIFTAGSNGISKGVMLSHRNICFNLSQMCSMIYIDDTDHFLSVLPLHHVYECTCTLLCALYRGATVTFCPGLRHLTRVLSEAQPTVMLSVPMLIETIYRKMWSTIEKQGLEKHTQNAIKFCRAIPDGKLRQAARRRLFSKVHQTFGGKLRLLLSGGAPADPEVLAGLREFGIAAYQCYSLSECAPLAAINHDRCYKDNSAGLSLPGALLDIYDMQDDGIGEIRYKADGVMLGYYDMPEKSARAIRDGWFYTGDLGTLDEDGFLHIVGGKKNVIQTTTGKIVFPEELEAMLIKSPVIREAMVVGKPHATKAGNEILALLYPDDRYIEKLYGKSYTKAELDLEIKKALAEVNGSVQAYKRIKTYKLRREEFPKTSSRKIDRNAVKKELERA